MQKVTVRGLSHGELARVLSVGRLNDVDAGVHDVRLAALAGLQVEGGHAESARLDDADVDGLLQRRAHRNLVVSRTCTDDAIPLRRLCLL